jgi:hypothetical protein
MLLARFPISGPAGTGPTGHQGRDAAVLHHDVDPDDRRLIPSFPDLRCPLDVCLLLSLRLQAYEASQPDAFLQSSSPASIVKEVCFPGLVPGLISARLHGAESTLASWFPPSRAHGVGLRSV